MSRKETDLTNDPTLLGNDQPRHDKHAPPANAERMTKSGRQAIPGGDVSEPANEEPVNAEDVDEEDDKL